MSYLLLARHGNTFEKGQIPFFVGKNENLPLASVGRNQAYEIAKNLSRCSIIPKKILVSQLLRSKDFGLLIKSELSQDIPLIVNPYLDEIDYGVWGGKTTKEIESLYGQAVLEQWEKYQIWPKEHWVTNKETLIQNLNLFLSNAFLEKGEVCLAITSNGILRTLLEFFPSNFEHERMNNNHKVSTGNLCLLHKERGVVFWNIPPALLYPLSLD